MSAPEPEGVGSVGGAANTGGVNYQAAISTHLAAVMLAERPHQLDAAFPPGIPIRVGCEQASPTDDIVVWSDAAIGWVQVKSNLDRGALRDAIVQFVGQYDQGRTRSRPTIPLEREDRLILAFDHGTAQLAQQLPGLLDRIRSGESIDEYLQASGRARKVYDALLDDLLAARPGCSVQDAHAILQHVRLYHAPVTPLAELTRDVLHDVVIENDVGKAYSVLAYHMATVAERRTLRDASALRQLLRDEGCQLLEPRSVRSDIERLTAHTTRTIIAETTARTMRVGTDTIHRDRPVTAALIRALALGNVIVTGDGGSGKSVVLLDAARRLRDGGAPVVFLNADDTLPISSPRFEDVLAAWAETGPSGYLFIDGLDGLRLGKTIRPLRSLIARLVGTRWHVAIASRSYDLEHSSSLDDFFPPLAGLEEYVDPRFLHTAHVQLDELSADDLTWFGDQNAHLRSLIVSASPDLYELIRNPFNLSIAVSLSTAVDLTDVRTRGDLLKRWWDYRIRDQGGFEREALLRAILRDMVARRATRLPAADVAAGTPLDDLLSQTVLTHRGEDDSIAFRHAVIFDYAVERLLLLTDAAIATLLQNDRDAFVFILPSLRARFEALYANPSHFFGALKALFADGRQRWTLLLILAGIPVRRIRDAEEIVPLLGGDAVSQKAFRVLVRTALRVQEDGYALVGEKGEPWAGIALAAATHLPAYFHDAALLVERCSVGPASPEQRQLLGAASRMLMAYHLDAAESGLGWRAIQVIGSFCRTFDTDPAAAQPLLERLLDFDRLRYSGQHELQQLCYELEHIRNPKALETLYSRLFADVVLPEGQVMLGPPTVGLNFTQPTSQILETTRSQLAERFHEFFIDAPVAAVRALCLVVHASFRDRRFQRVLPMRFRGQHLLLVKDNSNGSDDFSEHEPWHIMATAFTRQLKDDLKHGLTDRFFTALAQIELHGPNLYLWNLLIRSAAGNKTSACAMLSFLLQPKALVAYELRDAIAAFFGEAYPLLGVAQQRRIQRALTGLVSGERNASRRRSRLRLREAYVNAIAPEASPRLSKYRARIAPTAEEQELTLQGAAISAATMGSPALSRDAAKAGASTALQDAIDAADDFIFLGGPAGSASENLAPTIRRILAAAENQSAAAKVHALDVLAELVRIGLERNVFTDEEVTAFETIVFDAAALVSAPNSDDDDNNDDVRWGSPSATTAAAIALVPLYRRRRTSRIAEAHLALTNHPSASVRFLALRGILVLFKGHTDEVWECVETAIDDKNLAVVDVAADVLERLESENLVRARRGLMRAHDRYFVSPKSDRRLKHLRRINDWALAGDPDGTARLDRVLTDPWSHADVAKSVAFDLGHRLDVGSEHVAQAVALLTTLAGRLNAFLLTLEDRHGTDLAVYPEADRRGVETSVGLLYEIAERVASAMRMPSLADGALIEVDLLERQRFDVLQPLLDELAKSKLGRTAYHLIRGLSVAIDAAPAEVLTLGTRAILAGIAGGLANDGTAALEVRKFLLQYVRRHRNVLESDQRALSGFMDVLDGFAEAGWPQWIDVALELDALYREP